MSDVFAQWSAWTTAALLAALLLAGWSVGWWSARRAGAAGSDEPGTKLNDASLAILGLLLAFTFSLSLGKHDQRRLSAVADSNSIGDFYTCASLLKEPVREKLQNVIRAYAESRLNAARAPIPESDLDTKLAEMQKMHDRMQALVGEAVDAATPIANPLVNTFNNLTSNHASRLAAARDRLPPSIVLLLSLSAVIAVVLVGWQQGATGKTHPAATIAFVGLLCMIVWVTLDLNQPQQGLIRVSQEPLERLLRGMQK
ncbi:MAG: DUF4239 domain-containing protein [Planctomycetes bacterium]|nr:DUF4239 domain-containing protein [Planctomycetota bacterium]